MGFSRFFWSFAGHFPEESLEESLTLLSPRRHKTACQVRESPLLGGPWRSEVSSLLKKNERNERKSKRLVNAVRTGVLCFFFFFGCGGKRWRWGKPFGVSGGKTDFLDWSKTPKNAPATAAAFSGSALRWINGARHLGVAVLRRSCSLGGFSGSFRVAREAIFFSFSVGKLGRSSNKNNIIHGGLIQCLLLS